MGKLASGDKVNILFSTESRDNWYDVSFISLWKGGVLIDDEGDIRLAEGVFETVRIVPEKEEFMAGLEGLKGDVEDTQFAEKMFDTGKYKYVGDKVAEV